MSEYLKKEIFYTGIAVENLRKALKQTKSDLIIDCAIKRFDMSFDLMWKTLKAYMEEAHNVKCVSPKSCFREAYNKQVITEYDNFWLELADKRNLTAHTYNEVTAEEVYAILPNALEHFKLLLEKMRTRE